MGTFESEILAALLMKERLQQAELRRMTRMASGRRDVPALTLALIGSTLIRTGSALQTLAQRRRRAGIGALSADLCRGCPN